MDYKNTSLTFAAAMAFRISPEGISFTITKNLNHEKTIIPQEIERRCAELLEVTTGILKSDSHSPKPKDGQR